MKLLILGGGFNQLNTIRKAKAKGHTVVVSDYLPNAPGKEIADYSELVSTFDIEGNTQVAQKYKVDGILTTGTDQPVLTAAAVAQALHLPHTITTETALKATNKQYMKKAFTEHNIPSAQYCLINKAELEDESALLEKLARLNFPIVVKPLDSQGQRGVYKLYGQENMGEYLTSTFSFTNLDTIIVEEFFAGDEITVSLWIENYKPYILMITDRPLLNVEPHLGIPDGHIFPSKYLHSHYHSIYSLVENLIQAFAIAAGPLYIQLMVRDELIEVVEIACRIGGGHEEELIPLVTGIDVVEMLIDKTAGVRIDINKLEKYNLLNNPHYAMVKFLIARSGEVEAIGSLEAVRKTVGVVNAAFYNPNIKQVRELVDSTCRVGYMLVTGTSYTDLSENVVKAYREVSLYNEAGENMVYNRSNS